MTTNEIEKLIDNAVYEICDEASELIDGAGTTQGVSERAKSEIAFVVAYIIDKHEEEKAAIFREIMKMPSNDIIVDIGGDTDVVNSKDVIWEIAYTYGVDLSKTDVTID